MPPDPVRIDETRLWIGKARADLRAAAVDLDADPPLFEDALFHCQQAAEKALKAFLTWHDRPFRKTHNLVELGGQCAEIDQTLEPLLQRAAKLTDYAAAYRYPGVTAVPTPEETRAERDLATELVDAVLAALPPEVGSSETQGQDARGPDQTTP